MSSHLIYGCVTPDDQELLNLRRQLPHALPRPPGLPHAWRTGLADLQGYTFPWGHLVETPNGLKDPDSPHDGGTSWRLLPTILWNEVRVRAPETCCHWQTLLWRVNCNATTILATYVPDWLVCRVTERYFLGELVAVGDQDSRRARAWLAGCLLTRHIDALLRGYRDCLLEAVATDCDTKPPFAIDEVTQ